MAFNFLERLGVAFGQQVAERVLHHEQPVEAAPAAEAPPPAEAAPETPPAEAYASEPAPTYEAPAEPAPAETYQVPEPEPAVAYQAPTAETYTAPALTYLPPITAPTPDSYTTPEPAPAPVAEVPAAPPEPVKSAEEIEEERLWGETDAAWAAGDFQKVTECLDALKALQPEDAALIDEKIAAAQYNQASSFEQAGELERALYLYQEAQRRNPNLGEAGYAVERVQSALNPPAPPAEAEPAPPPEQTYTVQDGDSLWAIAERYYGDGNQNGRIFEANRDQLDNPDVIQPGQVLRIPT